MSKGFLSQWWDWCSPGALVPWCDRVRHEDQWGRDPLIPSPLLVGSHPLVCKYGIPGQRDHHRAPSKQHQESLCIVQVQVFWLLEVIGCLLSKGKTLLGITQRQLSSCREQASGKNSSVTKEKRWKIHRSKWSNRMYITTYTMIKAWRSFLSGRLWIQPIQSV